MNQMLFVCGYFLMQRIRNFHHNRRLYTKRLLNGKKAFILLSLFCATSISSFTGLLAYKSISKFGANNVKIMAPARSTSQKTNKPISFAKFNSYRNILSRDNNALVQYIAKEIIAKTASKVNNAKDLALQIVLESQNAGEDPLFIAAVIFAESSFRRTVRSPVGALGLMQLMPNTGKYIAHKINYGWEGHHSLKNPETNLHLGIAYLQYLKGMFKGNINNVLLAYNWGPGNVKKGLSAPKISKNYSSKIQRLHKSWKDDFNSRINQFRYSQIDALIS